MRFAGKTAVVLGGNSGIGLEAAKKFAAQGAKVVITGRNEKTLATAKDEAGAVAAIACDIADNAAMEDFYANLPDGVETIDMLVINAGVGGFSPVRDVTEEFWDSVHSVNLRGAFFAAQKALDHAGAKISDMAAIKSHNPFAVNDIAFVRATGADPKIINNYGCSLIWGHPNAVTAQRLIIELIEELALKGGGLGLFQGCAAGDTSMACVVEVSGR